MKLKALRLRSRISFERRLEKRGFAVAQLCLPPTTTTIAKPVSNDPMPCDLRTMPRSCSWRRALFVAVILLSASSTFPLSSVQPIASCHRQSVSRFRPHKVDDCFRRRSRSRRRTAELCMGRNVPETASGDTRIDDETAESIQRMQGMKQETLRQLKEKNFDGALNTIENMVAVIKNAGSKADGAHIISMSALVDESVQTFTNLAFAQPFHRGSATRNRTNRGLGAIHLQLSSADSLAPPFDTMPRATFVNALKALANIITNDNEDTVLPGRSFKPLDAAFRILQRLVTGRGVRRVAADQSMELSERDFNLVLNAACHIGRMDVAHKIVALQERSSHAPPLSPVAYSILVKGYGRLRDVLNVKMILFHAGVNEVKPDIIMLNSVIDAFVNCNELETALDIFHYMKDPGYQGHELSRYSSLLLSDSAHPEPNRRTYNTILKGLARKGDVDTAMHLSREMKLKDLWDRVTTNTLVSAAVKTRDFDLAASILANHTITLGPDDKRPMHPNVEAYTELLDGYAKDSQLEKALGILQLMGERGVEANEYTYTCMIGGLARAKKVDQAQRMLQYMQTKKMKPRTVTYNAFISGLLTTEPYDEQESESSDSGNDNFSHYASVAIRLLTIMLKNGVRPNSITVSVLVDGLGRCEPPRLAEAKALVTKLRKDGMISADDRRVTTSLIRTCGVGADLPGALENFRSLNKPDTIAVNAFLDACCRCEKEKLAFETFKHYFGDASDNGLSPDVVTYSTLIRALLKQGSPKAMQRTIVVYNEMRKKREIHPDKVLVDIILTAMVRGGRIGITKRDIQFARAVIRDAENLEWEPGQLEKRKQSVGAVLIGRVSEVWKENESLYGMGSTTIRSAEEVEDELFKKKGWNKVDSGFRLWGGGLSEIATRKIEPESEGVVDEFLASKGWNDVDSSFRII